MIICTIVTGVYYLDTFSLSSDPELILLGLYFNGFYIIYLIIKNNREDTEEQINDPEDPTRPTPLSTDPTNSETDGGDILPSYEESFNYPNSDVDNIDKPKIDDSNSNNKKMMTCKYYVYFCVSSMT